MAAQREGRKANHGKSPRYLMNTTPTTTSPKKTPQYTVEAARRLLEQALEAEAEQENEEAVSEVAHKRAINAHTGASILVPPEVASRDVPAFPEPHHGN